MVGSHSPANVLLTEGITVSILGMCIVFSVLIILWITLEIMNAIFNKKGGGSAQKSELKPQSAAPAPAATASVAKAEVSAASSADENVIAAVCAAAVASILGSTGFVIHSIKRQSAWHNR